MAVRIRQLDAYTLYATNVAASGPDWDITLGEFKGLQRALNANYPAITQHLIVVDGRPGWDTLREAQRFGKVDLAWLAENARTMATDIAETAGAMPNFSPSVLHSDYRGGATQQLGPVPALEPELLEPELLEPELLEPSQLLPELLPEPAPTLPEPRLPRGAMVAAPPTSRAGLYWGLGGLVAVAGIMLWREWRRG